MSSSATAERRRQPRHPAEGDVVLIFSEPAQLEVPAKIIDQSARGFRVAHAYKALSPGQKAQLRAGTKVMQVQVMWTRIARERVECGLLIL